MTGSRKFEVYGAWQDVVKLNATQMKILSAMDFVRMMREKGQIVEGAMRVPALGVREVSQDSRKG